MSNRPDKPVGAPKRIQRKRTKASPPEEIVIVVNSASCSANTGITVEISSPPAKEGKLLEMRSKTNER